MGFTGLTDDCGSYLWGVRGLRCIHHISSATTLAWSAWEEHSSTPVSRMLALPGLQQLDVCQCLEATGQANLRQQGGKHILLLTVSWRRTDAAQNLQLLHAGNEEFQA